jgi:hypothetical protein
MSARLAYRYQVAGVFSALPSTRCAACGAVCVGGAAAARNQPAAETDAGADAVRSAAGRQSAGGGEVGGGGEPIRGQLAAERAGE